MTTAPTAKDENDINTIIEVISNTFASSFFSENALLYITDGTSAPDDVSSEIKHAFSLHRISSNNVGPQKSPTLLTHRSD